MERNIEYQITNLEYRREMNQKMNERRIYDFENRLIDFVVEVIKYVDVWIYPIVG